MRIYHRMQMQKIFLVSGAVMNSFFFYWNADRSHLILLGEACRVLWQAVAGRPPRRKDGNKTKKTHSENDIH